MRWCIQSPQEMPKLWHDMPSEKGNSPAGELENTLGMVIKAITYLSNSAHKQKYPHFSSIFQNITFNWVEP